MNEPSIVSAPSLKSEPVCVSAPKNVSEPGRQERNRVNERATQIESTIR